MHFQIFIESVYYNIWIWRFLIFQISNFVIASSVSGNCLVETIYDTIIIQWQQFHDDYLDWNHFNVHQSECVASNHCSIDSSQFVTLTFSLIRHKHITILYGSAFPSRCNLWKNSRQYVFCCFSLLCRNNNLYCFQSRFWFYPFVGSRNNIHA